MNKNLTLSCVPELSRPEQVVDRTVGASRVDEINTAGVRFRRDGLDTHGIVAGEDAPLLPLSDALDQQERF